MMVQPARPVTTATPAAGSRRAARLLRSHSPQFPSVRPVEGNLATRRALRDAREQVDILKVAPQVFPETRTVVAAHTEPRRVKARGGSRRSAVQPRSSWLVRGVSSVAGATAVSLVGLFAVPSAAVLAPPAPVTVGSISLAGGIEEKPGVESQSFAVSSSVQGQSSQRETGYSAFSLSERASELGITFSDSLYSNDTTAAIQWPFAVGVAMSSEYGQRNGRLHAGIDLVPGDGAAIQAIADGTVRTANESGGAYGVHVYVDHNIDGKLITSHYAHMQYGSLQVAAGDAVEVGDTIGLVGNTGRSYGPHLHFEILVDGSIVNPLPWLRANAGRHSYF